MATYEDTLYAFIVEFPRQASVVSILGSWDNFQRPYPLRKDTRGGREVWRAYSTFTGIVCDGDRLRGPEESRHGSLRTGGTYWYYYQINNDGEHCDRSKSTTRACPFLPGQEVNVLEVPVRIQHPSPSAGSTDYIENFTLDPETKYSTLPSRNSMRPQSRHLALALARPNSLASGAASVSSTESPCSENNNYADHDLAAPSTSHTGNTYSTDQSASESKDLLGLISLVRAGELRLAKKSSMSSWNSATYSLNENFRPASSRNGNTNWADDMGNAVSHSSTSRHGSRTTMEKRSYGISSDRSKVFSLPWRPGKQAFRRPQRSQSQYRCSNDSVSSLRQSTHVESSIDLALDRPGSNERASISLRYEIAGSDAPQPEGNDASKTTDSFRPSNLGYSNTTSTRSSSFYPPLALTSVLTEATCSSPITPVHSEFSFGSDVPFLAFEDDLDRRAECYQPEENHSVLTLKNVNKLADDSAATPTKPTHHSHGSASKRVHEWSSTIEEPSSDLQDMCDDLGYLRAMIT